MRILLTGSAGFIGSAIHDHLTATGHEVVAVDLMLAAAHGDAAPPAGTHPLDVRRAVGDPDWATLLSGIDVVCHQAAAVGTDTSAADLPLYASHNDLGTAALLAAMADHHITRLVLASSMVVYGEGCYVCPEHGGQAPAPRSTDALEAGDFEVICTQCGMPLAWLAVPEGAPLRPRSAYAASKVAQEHYAAAWARQTGSRVVALRYHNVYGPRMPRDTPYSGVAAMFRSSLERGERPQVYEDGLQTRDFVHVSDVAVANGLAIAAVTDVTSAGPRGHLSAYNIASGRPITIAQVASAVAGGRALAGAKGLEPEITGRYRLGDVRHVVASPDLARGELGFSAAIAPQDGLRDFATAPLRPRSDAVASGATGGAS